jgi:hypothetical protein
LTLIFENAYKNGKGAHNSFMAFVSIPAHLAFKSIKAPLHHVSWLVIQKEPF